MSGTSPGLRRPAPRVIGPGPGLDGDNGRASVLLVMGTLALFPDLVVGAWAFISVSMSILSWLILASHYRMKARGATTSLALLMSSKYLFHPASWWTQT